jgi:hypothetical protein
MQAPVVSGFSPNGQYLWVADYLVGSPSNQNNWSVQDYDYWYAGSLGGPPLAWTNYYTGVPRDTFGALDAWQINSGWTVTVVQYTYADGYWQWNAPSLQYCSF